MSYIGNNPDVNAFTVGVQRFNGTGACTQFTLTRTISDAKAIEVIVNGIQQDPDNSYTVSAGVITFSEAPSTGTNNITVTYRAPVVVTFNQVTSSQLQTGSVNESALAVNSVTNQKIQDGAVTGNKLTDNSVRGNNIVAGQITGNLIVDNGIRGNNIVAGQITGNLIATNSINASNTMNQLSVTGNLIGIGAISANNFAGGGITSNVLSSNLTISTSRVAETINVVTTSIQGNYNVHVGNTTVYHFLANSAGNTTFNFVSNDALSTGTTGRVNDLISIGQSVSVAMLFKQGSTRYRANVYVDGVLQTAYWAGNTQPLYQTSQSMSYDAYNFSIIKIAPNEYTVFASNTPYGQANGQGMNSITGAYGQLQ